MDDIKVSKNKKSNTSEDVLIVNNIEVVYSHVILVLKGVSLKVKKGGITALLGGNGAGKSTTLKSISNLLASERGEVTKGSVTYSNEYIHDLDPSQLVKKGVIQVMEGRHCFEHLTVEENLLTGAYTRTNNKEVKEDLERAERKVMRSTKAVEAYVKKLGKGSLGGFFGGKKKGSNRFDDDDDVDDDVVNGEKGKRKKKKGGCTIA